jgi:hypothetical protein
MAGMVDDTPDREDVAVEWALGFERCSVAEFMPATALDASRIGRLRSAPRRPRWPPHAPAGVTMPRPGDPANVGRDKPAGARHQFPSLAWSFVDHGVRADATPMRGGQTSRDPEGSMP